MAFPIKPVVGQQFEHSFRFTQDDVIKFAAVTGDNNPVHLDETFAATTPFKKPILHGFLSGSVFSKVFGTIFPGEGSIYLSQQMSFKRPMYAGQEYLASFTITEADESKGILTIAGKITDSNGKVCLEGEGKLMNRGVFNKGQ
ncbi:MAG TPA: MaoC family dehydratase [Cyclobacteriaceae bacterium]|nr:MaoC family dehydratase [Cyclobacteriaceae bacterium]